MAITVGEQLYINSALPIDSKKYFNSLDEALIAIPRGRGSSTVRYIGQKFTVKDDSDNGFIGPRDYWFKDGIENSNCVPYLIDNENLEQILSEEEFDELETSDDDKNTYFVY